MDFIKEIAGRCCGKKYTIKIPLEGYLRWRNGLQHIQDAMPQVSDGDRELLKSGICEACFDTMLKEEDDE